MKKILCVSDLHVGHLASIMPEDFGCELPSGHMHIYNSNGIQDILINEWNQMLKKVGKVDAVFDLGDNIEGCNKKEAGYGLWTADLNVQAKAASQLLASIKTNNYYGVHGSNYHVGTNPSSEATVYDGIKKIKPKAKIHHAKELLVNFGDWKAHLLHEVSCSMSTWQFRTTAIAKEMLMAEINKKELGQIRLIIRGHAHYYVEVKYGNTLGFVCPSWKLRDVFTARMGLTTIPRVGWVLLEVDKDGTMRTEPHIVKEKIPLMKEVKI